MPKPPIQGYHPAKRGGFFMPAHFRSRHPPPQTVTRVTDRPRSPRRRWSNRRPATQSGSNPTRTGFRARSGHPLKGSPQPRPNGERLFYLPPSRRQGRCHAVEECACRVTTAHRPVLCKTTPPPLESPPPRNTEGEQPCQPTTPPTGVFCAVANALAAHRLHTKGILWALKKPIDFLSTEYDTLSLIYKKRRNLCSLPILIKEQKQPAIWLMSPRRRSSP